MHQVCTEEPRVADTRAGLTAVQYLVWTALELEGLVSHIQLPQLEEYVSD